MLAATPVIEAPVALVFQWYVGLTGLETDTVADPLLLPQVVGVDEVLNATPFDGVTVTLDIDAQPCTSCTVTV